MAEYVKAFGMVLGGAGMVLGGAGMLVIGRNVDAIGEKGLKHIGDGIKGGLEGHMSVETAGQQLGKEAFSSFQKLQHEHSHFLGDAKRS